MTSILPLPLPILPAPLPHATPFAQSQLTTTTAPATLNPLKVIVSPEEAALFCKSDMLHPPTPQAAALAAALGASNIFFSNNNSFTAATPTITNTNNANQLANHANAMAILQNTANHIMAVNNPNPNNNNNINNSSTGSLLGTTASSSNSSSPTEMMCSPTTTLPPPLTLPNELVSYVPYGIPVTPVSPSQTMEIVWHGEFNRLFTQYFPHTWHLVPTFYPPSERWRVFKDSAKVRFSCQECGHGWTSMKGRVIFWFHLNYSTNSGYVMFKLYGQQCQKCKNGNYEHAMWYPEEVIKVIGNVYNRVGQIFYGFVRPPLRIDRRQGKPRNQHNAELCQACKEGLCKEEWSFS